jgi:hypothetical protein
MANEGRRAIPCMTSFSDGYASHTAVRPKEISMNQQNEAFIMRPGDTFVADECGCSFTVESGPGDESMAQQAPTCCCGHQMHKEGYGNINGIVDEGLHAMRGESDAALMTGSTL